MDPVTLIVILKFADGVVQTRTKDFASMDACLRYRAFGIERVALTNTTLIKAECEPASSSPE